MHKLKNVITTWVLVYVLITSLYYSLQDWLSLFPLFVRTGILSGVMVFGLQFVVFPILAKIREAMVKSNPSNLNH